MPCTFKHTKNDGHFAMLLQCLLDHTQQKLFFCLFLLLRNNVSKTVYINLRLSVWLVWLHAHIGQVGNEHDDQLAKLAISSTLECTNIPLPCSISFVKPQIMTNVTQQ